MILGGFITFKELSAVGLPRCDLEGDDVTLQQLSISTSNPMDKLRRVRRLRKLKTHLSLIEELDRNTNGGSHCENLLRRARECRDQKLWLEN